MWKEQAFQMWYLWKMLAFEDMSYYQMKVKVFQLWHLWQVVTLEVEPVKNESWQDDSWFKIFPNFTWADRKITVFAMLQQ